MVFSSSIFAAALSVISLDGIVAGDITASADFDAYNVHAGDPMELTVDFMGEADFLSLQPPKISEVVDSSIWKVDDKSASTADYRGQRRITYRVRPVKEGCLEFPRLTFSYIHHKIGKKAKISTCAIPVHSKKASQIELSLSEEENAALPLPDGIVIDLTNSPWGSGKTLNDDEMFAWRKACTTLNPESFKDFDFPEARLNEAACEILAGNWQRAMSIYTSLEWKIGQTPAVERGIVAAIALKTSNPDAELPIWRQILRPLLKYSWVGRSLWSLGLVLIVASLIFASRVLLKRLACLAVAVVLSCSAFAIDPFAEFEQMQEEMMREMNAIRSMGVSGGNRISVNGVGMSQPEITAKVAADKTHLVVGETFNLIVSLDAPKDYTLSAIRINSSRRLGLTSAGPSENLPDEPGETDDRVVKRMSIPLRYDVPFKEDVHFYVVGMSERVIRKGNYWSSFSSNFSENAGFLKLEVKCLDGIKTPDDYNGCVGHGFTATQRLDVSEVETNDVVAAVITVKSKGAFIPGNAFVNEQGRERNMVVYKKVFRATGGDATPDVSFSYYDPSKKDFCRVVAKGIPLKYVVRDDRETKNVVLGAAKGKTKIILRFAPSESALEIASISKDVSELTVTEIMGEWVRVDDGEHAGWVKKRDLKNE